MFKEYESKPITRLALQITDLTELESVDDTTLRFTKGKVAVLVKHYEPVKVGDFIVYLNESDIYHCSEKVFKERNIVQ